MQETFIFSFQLVLFIVFPVAALAIIMHGIGLKFAFLLF